MGQTIELIAHSVLCSIAATLYITTVSLRFCRINTTTLFFLPRRQCSLDAGYLFVFAIDIIYFVELCGTLRDKLIVKMFIEFLCQCIFRAFYK